MKFRIVHQQLVSLFYDNILSLHLFYSHFKKIFFFLNIYSWFDLAGGSDSKASAYNAEDLSLIPGLGRAPGEENSYPHQYSGLENSMDYVVHGVGKSQTPLSDFHLLL